MGKQYGMMKRLIAGVLMFITAMGASATGQSGDIITIDGEQWNLLGKPIDWDSVLYKSLLKVLPEERSINTANWDGYTAYWSIRNDRLYLDRIEVELYNKETRHSRKANITEADMHRVFGKYMKNGRIEASWFSMLELRAGKGRTVYYVHSGYCRNQEHELILSIERGKIVKRLSYHNRVVVADGFSFDNINQEEIRRRFPLHTQNYPKLADVGRLIITISKVQLDSNGNLLDCNIKVTHRDMKGSIEGLAQEVKTLLKQIHPWKTLYINGEYVSTLYHQSITLPYVLALAKTQEKGHF